MKNVLVPAEQKRLLLAALQQHGQSLLASGIPGSTRDTGWLPSVYDGLLKLALAKMMSPGRDCAVQTNMRMQNQRKLESLQQHRP